MPTASRRRAFTLVELLTVVAIIGLLVAMLIPAVQAAREAARRTTCGNNIRQIGIALQSHMSLIGTLPAAAQSSPGGGFWPWTVAILPYLEQASVADSLRAASPANYTGVPRTIAESPMPSFICPSCSVGVLDTAATWRQKWGVGLRSSKSNYLGNAGPQVMWGGAGCSNPLADRQVNNMVQVSRGAIRRLRGLPASLIIDGLSSTFLVGEAGGAGLSQETQLLLPGLWAAAYNEQDHMFSGLRYGFSKLNAGNSLHSFGSFHPGGANFVMCDGSVRFVSELISHIPGNLQYAFEFCPVSANAEATVAEMRRPVYGVYQYLSNRDDRQVISSESF